VSNKDEKQPQRRKEVENSIALFALKYMDVETYGFCLVLLKLLSQYDELGFQRGKKEVWAAAIVLSIARCNFMLDKNEEWWMTVDEIAEHFDANKSTISQKSTKLLDSLSDEFIGEFLTRACLQRMFEVENINGVLMPISLGRDVTAKPLKTEQYIDAKLLFDSYEKEFGTRISRKIASDQEKKENMLRKNQQRQNAMSEKQRIQEEERLKKQEEIDRVQPSLFDDF
jgi:hypothetical protein